MVVDVIFGIVAIAIGLDLLVRREALVAIAQERGRGIQSMATNTIIAVGAASAGTGVCLLRSSERRCRTLRVSSRTPRGDWPGQHHVPPRIASFRDDVRVLRCAASTGR